MSTVNPQALRLNPLSYNKEGTVQSEAEANFEADDESDPNQSDEELDLNPG
jgi:hypothetical protein